MDIAQIRSDFPILSQKHNDKSLCYFDNAATAQKPKQVIEAISKYYETSNANIHRGIHFLGEKATDMYEAARETVREFLNAKESREIIFTSNLTESINLVAYSYVRSQLHEGDEILLTHAEHHSNIVPWHIIAKEKGLKIKFLDVDDEGRLQMDQLPQLLTDKTKFLSVAHVSNVLGIVNDIKAIIAMAKEKGIVTCIDASQSAPHLPLDVQDLDCDFLALTGHKICGPTGIGVLYGREALLEAMPPMLGGGGMISEVRTDGFLPADIPALFEAGTPNIAGAVGLKAALDYIQSIGFDTIHEYETKLTTHLLSELLKLDFVDIVGTTDPAEKIPLVSFTVEGVHAHDIAEVLNSEAVCVRAGHHCAQVLMDRFNIAATARASLAFYNTEEEIDQFIEAVKKVQTVFA